MKAMSFGLKEALELVRQAVRPLPVENVDLVGCVDRIVASDLYALVDSPSIDSSRKDGYAVVSHQVADATKEKPIRLKLLGLMAAGGDRDIPIRPGTAVKVLTGARVPTGADAVVAEEYAKEGDHEVLVQSFAVPGNVQRRGGDISAGSCVLAAGSQISPVTAGLLAAAGHSVIPVLKNPVIGLIGTGDEIVEPGSTLTEGGLYASNIITLAGWCRRFGMKTRLAIAKDDRDAISKTIDTLSGQTDALITSGGAWTGEHDLVARVLGELGWREIFHRIRIGPGKAVGFGILNGKPVFLLAGGPPSNLVGFLQIALPGLLALGGNNEPVLPELNAELAAELKGSDLDWTDFFFGTLEYGSGLPSFHPMKKRTPLRTLAKATALASVPEGKSFLPAGSIIKVQLIK